MSILLGILMSNNCDNKRPITELVTKCKQLGTLTHKDVLLWIQSE